MTSLDRIRSMTETMITADVAAGALGVKAQSLRVAAHVKPEALGFPVCVIGRAVRIPRIPFLNYLTGGNHAENDSPAEGTG